MQATLRNMRRKYYATTRITSHCFTWNSVDLPLADASWLVPANMQAAARMPPAAVARRRFYDEAVAFVEQLLRQTGASGCSRLRAELQYLGSAAAVVMSKQHARLAIDGNYDAWADLAREVLSSKFLYDELGS